MSWIKFLFSAALFSTIIFGQNWHSIGPAGKPLSITVSSSYIILGTQQAGIAKSTDYGQNWTYVDGMPPEPSGSSPSNAITCLVHDPADFRNVYAGTGYNETSTGHGIYKSTDRGDTWEQKNSGLPQSPAVREISINPANSQEIFILCMPNDIYKSTNGGDSWSLLFSGNLLASSLIFDISNPSVQYAVGRDGSLYLWQDTAYTVITPNTNLFNGGYPLNVFLNQESGSLFYIQNSNVYRWNGIDDWERITDTIMLNGKSIVSAAVNPLGSMIYLSSDEAVFNSFDDGQTWFVNLFVNNCEVAVDNNFALVVGNDGVFRSTDGGMQWTRTADGPKINSLTAGSAVYSPEGNILYALVGGYNSSGSPVLYKTEDDGISWNRMEQPAGLTLDVIRANPLNPEIVYLAGFNPGRGGLYKSYDGGSQFTQILPDSATQVNTITISEKDTGRIILGFKEFILGSTNSGASWDTSMFPPNNYWETRDVQISQINDSVICAATIASNMSQAGFLITTDKGASWERRMDGLPNALIYAEINSIAIDPKNDSIIFIGNGAGVYKTTNQGILWDTCGFPVSLPVSEIRIADDNSDIIFATCREDIGIGGLYYSTDGGVEWEEAVFPGTADLSRSFVNVIPNGNVYSIYTGTLSYGCYTGEIPRTETSIEPDAEITGYSLYQNYPNPFNPETEIKYSVPHLSQVLIEVFNVLGEKIKSLVNREMSAGNYRTKWNASGQPSGVYLLRMETGSFSQTLKMVLLK